MPTAGQPAAWLVVDAFGNRMGQPHYGTLAEVAPFAAGRRLRVCVPGTEVVLLYADLPTHNQRKILQAVPFALEDRVAEDLDNLHFAVGAHEARGYPVAVVTRAHMRQWLEELNAVGLMPAELVADVLTLPTREHTLIVALDDGQVMARFPDGSGIVADRTLMPLLLKRQLAMLPDAQACTHALVYTADDAAQQAANTLFADLDLEISYSHLNAGAIGVMVGGPRTPQVINLLQGAFGRRAGAAEYWLRWRVAAVLLAALVAIFIAQQAVSEFQLRREADSLRTQVAALFHSAMPDMQNVSDLGVMKSVMRRRLSQLTGGEGNAAGLLPMLTPVATALQSQTGSQLQGFSYHAGVLQLQVQAGSIDALNNLKSALVQDAAFQVQLDSVNSSAGQTTGRLTLRGGGK
jgi:general secretion pathway protein L